MISKEESPNMKSVSRNFLTIILLNQKPTKQIPCIQSSNLNFAPKLKEVKHLQIKKIKFPEL